MKKRKKKAKKWIQYALVASHKGALHRALKVPEGQKIPLEKLRVAAKRKDHVGRMARFAENLRK